MARLSLPIDRRAGTARTVPARRIARVVATGLLLLSLAAGGRSAGGASWHGPASGRVQSGSGFFVAPPGFVVTSRHVILGCPDVSIWADGVLSDADVIAADPKLDIALLSAKGRSRGGLVSRYRDDLRPGHAVMTIGRAIVATDPKAVFFSPGIFVRRGTLSPGYPVLIVRAHLRPGDSGAPVIDRSGALVGMVIGRLADRADLGIVITAAEINRFLSRSGVVPLTRAATRPRAAVPSRSPDRISALVQCRAL